MVYFFLYTFSSVLSFTVDLSLFNANILSRKDGFCWKQILFTVFNNLSLRQMAMVVNSICCSFMNTVVVQATRADLSNGHNLFTYFKERDCGARG
jgi:hypothetical protein